MTKVYSVSWALDSELIIPRSVISRTSIFMYLKLDEIFLQMRRLQKYS